MPRYTKISALALLALLAGAPLGGVDMPTASAGTRLQAPVPTPPDATQAPIALLVDLSSGQTLFARDAQRRFVPASLTKVMTLFTAFELMQAGKLTSTQRITISPEVGREWGGRGSTLFLQEGEQVSVDQLLRGIATVSANDGCIALAEAATGSVEAWIGLMNAHARELGMTGSHFGTPNGWMDEGQTFTTAHDLAILGKALVERHPQLYQRYIGHKTLSFEGIAQQNHDPLIGVFDGADGIKTGFTRQAGYGYLGSAEQNGRRLMMVVAASPAAPQRAKAARALMGWGFAAFRSSTLVGEGQPVAYAKVQDGAERSVPLVAHQPISLAVADGFTPDRVQYSLRYEGPLQAPLTAGQQVATLDVAVNGAPPFSIPLYAERAVPRANAWQRVRNGVTGIGS
ncbi:MAG: D-alanyl-D-alanine carboxypeptidase family protein [Caenibius sp.]